MLSAMSRASACINLIIIIIIIILFKSGNKVHKHKQETYI